MWLMIAVLVAVGVTSACTLTPTLSEMACAFTIHMPSPDCQRVNSFPAATVDEMGGGAYGQVYAIFNWFYALGMLGGTCSPLRT
jgi:hypothetical protein